MLIKIGDIFRNLAIKVVIMYLDLPLWMKILLLPVQLLWWVTVFIIGWLMMIPYVAKYGKKWREMDYQHQYEFTKNYMKKHYDCDI